MGNVAPQRKKHGPQMHWRVEGRRIGPWLRASKAGGIQSVKSQKLKCYNFFLL